MTVCRICSKNNSARRERIRYIWPMEIHFLLFLAGLVGGAMNALAGGGSGVTFAALVVSGASLALSAFLLFS